MAKNRKIALPDPFLFALSATLIFLGILLLASVSASFSLQTFGTTFYFFNHQIFFGLLPGLLGAVILYFLPTEFIKKWSFAALIATTALLLLVFVPGIGSTEGGAHRWLFLGPFSFQPSELLKLTSILYLAAFLSNRTEKLTLAPFVVIIGVISLLLILQPDISTMGIIAATAIFMYFAANTPLSHTALMIVGGLGVLSFLIQLAPYRLSRLAVFLNPSLDPLGQGYQIKQALIGIGSGGITGAGLGLSFQKFGLLPEPISDSIFAIVAEELGFLGAATLVLLFLLFTLRAFQLAKNLQDPFAKITALGITTWISLQALINMGAIIGLLPLTGIPLPFISYGGSALVVELLAVGILLKLTKSQKSYRI